MIRKFFILFLTLSSLTFADYTLKDGKLVEREPLATQSVQEHYSALIQHYEKQDWRQLEKEAQIVIKNFPSTPFARDAAYFIGAAYFHLEDYEMANHHLTNYLTHQATPKYFEEAIRYKFQIAEKFRFGARKHLMGFKSLPRWAPAGTEAIEIYDEVISALPHDDLAAQSLYGKAGVYAKNEDYRAAIESYRTVIRRFPKHPLAIESYISVGEVYLKQSRLEYPDPDLVDLAELNLKKFRTSFPGEEKIAIAHQNYVQMQELYVGSFFETARFYERTNKWGAAKIYYMKIVKSYPDSYLAKKSQERLDIVIAKIAKIEAKKPKK
ncbi:MAG: Outer membrane protein assembly factor BamD [Chlamydiae bacterium]|nr:Outer membrane protein assembly factor BamD [Chlamydiota bacterium]